MASAEKKVKFDPYNIVTRSDPTSEGAEILILIPCEDGAVAKVTVKVESPTKIVGEEGQRYNMDVTSSYQVTMLDRSLGEGGRRQRSDGLSWEIPTNYPGASIALLDHEKKIKKYLMDHFKENGVFVDVGANIGGYSVRAAAWDMKVYAFEPNPENVKILRRNAEINHMSVNIFPYAIGSAAGKARLSLNGGISRIIAEDGVEVEVRTLDSFDLPGADLLKIDVEGYELEVLKGARRTLEKFHPVMMIEMHYWAGAQKEADLFQILTESGYKFEYLDKFGLGMHLAAFPRDP